METIITSAIITALNEQGIDTREILDKPCEHLCSDEQKMLIPYIPKGIKIEDTVKIILNNSLSVLLFRKTDDASIPIVWIVRKT